MQLSAAAPSQRSFAVSRTREVARTSTATIAHCSSFTSTSGQSTLRASIASNTRKTSDPVSTIRLPVRRRAASSW